MENIAQEIEALRVKNITTMNRSEFSDMKAMKTNHFSQADATKEI